ncbi:hypothetical protein [Paenibacillus pinihumi]|uniref:hypothetical protein n=1 Tax=Paenibacillus pinihumi TaxID=669462 RepID=UPI0004133FC6|nr:hypothetical protein [Paenibacillus pinihumi]
MTVRTLREVFAIAAEIMLESRTGRLPIGYRRSVMLVGTEIAETDTHEELLRSGGIYARLYATQAS